MNKYYYDEILRMSVEMALFMTQEGNSINQIAEGLQVDKGLIREDVLNLFIFDEMRGLLQVNLDNVLNDDEEILNSYQLAYYELINMHDEIKKLEKAGEKYSKEDFEFVYDGIPEDFDIDGAWKKVVLKLFSKKGKEEEVDTKALLKNIDNARVRMMRRIKGTTETGEKKGRNKDGERYGILSGKYDDTNFILNDRHLNYDGENGEIMLPLSGEEYTHLNAFLEKNGNSLQKMDGLFKVKNGLDIKKDETELKYNILKKIQENKSIKFEYNNRTKGKLEWVKIQPKWINYNADTGFMYIVDSDEYSYRVDRIKGMEIYDLEAGEEIDKKKKLTKKMVDVVIDIPKSEGYDGLIFKIKEEARRRNMDPKYNVEDHFTEEEGKYVYKDKIAENDLGSFKSWVYSYGRSMIVIAPASLRKEVYKSYQERAKYY